MTGHPELIGWLKREIEVTEEWLHDLEMQTITTEARLGAFRDILVHFTETEAPTPLPVDQGQRAVVSITQEQRPADAKTSDQEPSADGSGGVQDRCESTPPPHSDAPEAPGVVEEPARSDSSAPFSPGEAAPQAEASAGEAEASPATLKQVVGAAMRDHPDWTPRQIAEATGRLKGSVQATMSILRREAASQSPVQMQEPVAAPIAEPDEPPSPLRPVPAHPKGHFYLRNDRGEYLHRHEGGMTRRPGFFWSGTEAEILDLKKRKHELRDLFEQVAA